MTYQGTTFRDLNRAVAWAEFKQMPLADIQNGMICGQLGCHKPLGEHSNVTNSCPGDWTKKFIPITCQAAVGSQAEQCNGKVIRPGAEYCEEHLED